MAVTRRCDECSAARVKSEHETDADRLAVAE
jgi:hypothetical protein